MSFSIFTKNTGVPMKKITAALSVMILLMLTVFTVSAVEYRDVSNSKVYPNPFNANKHSKITYDAGVSINAGYEMKVYNFNQRQVFSKQGSLSSGVTSWLGQAQNGERLAPGLYEMKIVITDTTNSIIYNDSKKIIIH